MILVTPLLEPPTLKTNFLKYTIVTEMELNVTELLPYFSEEGPQILQSVLKMLFLINVDKTSKTAN
jgi:hypothetical protein